MADPPKNERLGTRSSLRPGSRAESVAALLDAPLEDEAKVLEALVTALGSEDGTAELFNRLHDAAVAQERSANLSFAYERIARDSRLKLLPKPKQAEFLLHAARFFANVFGDVDAAISYAENARKLAPDESAVFDELETLLAGSQQGKKLAKLYSEQATQTADPSERLRFLRAAVELSESYGGTLDETATLYEQIVDVDPSDAVARGTLEGLYTSARRFKDLADLLERAIARGVPASGAYDTELRLRLVALYRGELRDPVSAAPHVETLLGKEPIDPGALQAAEALVDHRPIAPRIAPLLSEAYRRLDRLEDEASTLALELKFARPPRLADVHRRLAILRQDVLSDPAGALELLEPLVARDPTEDDLRRRYLEVSVTFHREIEAAKLLSRATAQVKDPAARSRVHLEIAGLYAKQGDVRRARAALAPAHDEAPDEATRLIAARQIVELSDDTSDPKLLARALESLVRFEQDLPTRTTAAKRLAELSEGPVRDPRAAIVAWRALVASPRGDEALDKLDALFSAAGDAEGMVEVLLARAARSKDPKKAAQFAFKATELRASRAQSRGAAIFAWRDFAKTYGPSREANAHLAKLLEQERDFTGLAALVERDVALAPRSERPALLGKLAQILLVELKDAPRALDALQAAIAEDPKDVASRKTLERLLASGEHRVDAAGILEPIYRAEKNHAGVVRILEARADLLTDDARRLAAIDEALRIAEKELSDPNRALDLAGRALREAAAHRRSELKTWFARFQGAAERADNPSRHAELLGLAILDLPIDDPELTDLAIEAAEALVSKGELGRAIDTYRQLLALEPSSEELLLRIDELLVEQGSPEERVALHRQALEQPVPPKRRRELLHSIARIQAKDLGNTAAAAEILKTLVSEYPTDLAAHDALAEALTALGATEELVTELERALAFTEGERRWATTERLAKAYEINRPARALELYQELLDADALSVEGALALADLAEAHATPETFARALERHVAREQDDGALARSLERLGNVRAQRLSDPEGAVAAWRQAARSSHAAGDDARTRSLYEAILDVVPEDAEAARYVVEAYTDDGEWEKVPAAFSILLRPEPSHDAIDLALSLEERAIAAGAIDAYVAVLDEALGRQAPETARRARELLSSKARAVASVPARRTEAAATFRGLVESFGDPRDVQAFSRFMEDDPLAPESFPDQRWVFAWRAEHESARLAVLEQWAAAEETRFGDTDAAVSVYAQVLEADPGHRAAREALCRLHLERGDAEGLLRTLRSARDRTGDDEVFDVDARIASLLVERLGRPAEAIPTLRSLIERAPDHPETVRLVRGALQAGESQRAIAEALFPLAASVDGASGTTLIEALLDETRGAPDLALLRVDLYLGLLDRDSIDAGSALPLSLAAAVDLPGEFRLWDAAERLARRAGEPQRVTEAYRKALSAPLTAELAEALGRRFVEFHEEWFDDPETVRALLERTLELSPRARWALDRLKLLYNADGRWEELFALYDRAIETATDDGDRVDLLDEAALAAKDLANDAERAIAYLERLLALRPESRVEFLLERLYERMGHLDRLFALLEKRVPSLSGAELSRLDLRLAKIRIDLKDARGAFAFLESVRASNAEEPQTYALFELLLAVPDANAVAASRKKGQGKKKGPSVLVEAIRILEERYRATKDAAGLARVLEVALASAETKGERDSRLSELVTLYDEALDQPELAFARLCSLVLLEPGAREPRRRLEQLAGKLGAENRRAEVLVRAAEDAADVPTKIEILREAALVHEGIGHGEEAAALYAQVLDLSGDPEATLETARILDRLLARLGQPARRCDVLERIATTTDDAGERKASLGELAQIAFGTLANPERAAAAWRRRIEDDGADLEALSGLAVVLEASGGFRELADVLERRSRLVDRDAARVDRVRVARLQSGPIGDFDAAIGTWRDVRTDFGVDDESFDALSSLLEAENRWEELGELLASAAKDSADPALRAALYRRLGDLHRDRTVDADRALLAYVEAGDFRRAQTAADNVSDRDAIERFARTLLDHSVRTWKSANAEDATVVSETAHFAIQTLVRRYLEDGAPERVVEVELLGAELPFERAIRRKFRRDAAFATCDRLEDAPRAISILEGLFEEDPADEIATACVTRFARLLDETGRSAELAALWACQAECRAAAGDRAGAAALFARAAEIAENRLGDVDRAVSLYRQGAATGGDASLEALARLYTAREDFFDAADALEWLRSHATREELAEKSLRLADVYLRIGEWERARARLEHAASTAMDAGNVRKRLAELYRDHQEWRPLAQLLVEEAERTRADGSRLSLLREAATIHSLRAHSPAESIPLLEQAVEIEPDDPSLRLALSAALRACGRLDESAEVLKAQIARYGSRRPKERATIHLHLGRVALEAGRRAEALSELDVGAKIDPAHPRILYELGRLAFEENQLPRAERTLRALLLVLRKPDADRTDAPSRAEIYLELGEIAVRQGEAERATELVESAFEMALESDEESLAFERVLGRMGRRDLLERAIESRLATALEPPKAARALSDLVLLHGPSDQASSETKERIETQTRRVHHELERRHEPSPGAWAALSSVYEWLGDSNGETRALECRVDAVVKSGASDDFDPLFRLAELRLADEARFDEGVSLVERVLDGDGDRERAWSLLESARRIRPTHSRVLELLERVARSSGRERALVEVTAWRAAAGPVDSASIHEAVDLAKKLGEPELVVALLRGALSHPRPDDEPRDTAWMRGLLARALIDRGTYLEAATILAESADLAPSPENRALLLDAARGVATERPELAGALYRQVLEADPANRDAWEPLLEVYRTSGDRGRLLALIQSTASRVGSAPDRSRLRLEEAALMLEDPARADDAIALLETVLVEDPANDDAVDLLSDVLERQGRIEKLLGIVAGQLEAAKRDADAQGVESAALKLGALLERHEQRDRALDAYSSILEWNPSSRAALRALVRLDASGPGGVEIADAIERLLPLEEPSAVGPLARRLVEHRAQQGDMLGVERALAIACAADPADASLREQLLARCLDHGDWDQAAGVLLRAADVDRSDTSLLLRAVEAYERAGSVDRAIETMGTVIERAGEDPDYFVERARLLDDAGRHDDALSDIEAAHAVDGSRTHELTLALEAAIDRSEGERRAEYTLRLADLLEEEGETTRAREQLGKLLKVQPRHRDAMRRFASLAALEARWDDAAAMYRRLIPLEEGELLIAVAMNLADACEHSGHLQDARGGLERALEAAPDNPELSGRLRQIYESTGAHQELAHLLLRGARAEPEVAARTNGLLAAAELLLERNGDPAEALAVLEEVRRLAPESIQGAVLLARAEAFLGRADEAVQALTSVIAAHRGKRTKDLSLVYRELSTIHLEDGDLSLALQALSKAFDLDTKNGELAMQLGHLALDMDDAATAARAFRSVTMMRVKQPGSPEGASAEAKAVAYYHLSRIAQAQGDVRRARLMASKAVSENPNHTEAQALLRDLRVG